MLMDHPIRYRQLRAPRANNEALFEPPLEEAGAAIERNRAARANAEVEIAGQPLAVFCREARIELLSAARRYTGEYRDLPDKPNFTGLPRILLAGHQPELFHPGVWIKNFVLSELAARHQAVGVNLLIDSDAVKSASIVVPAGSVTSPRRERVAYDRMAGEVPHEERQILDSEMFSSFATRVKEAIAPLVPNPLIEQYWPLVMEQATPGCTLGEAISQGRHLLEGQWGANTLELPQSHVCRLPAFHKFTAHLLAHLPRVWEHYNSALAEYRQVHHLRSAAQPLPDLAQAEGWLEAPYWVWTASNPVRQRLFVRSSADQLELTDRAGWRAKLDLTADGDFERGVEQLFALAGQGVKLRTRALATTMFARLVLSDLFLHGIGGAKYDQVTDRIIGQVFDFPPPEFFTVTATVKLPVERPDVPPQTAGELRHQLRELGQHPERFLQTGAGVSAADIERLSVLIAEKTAWIRTPKTPQNANTRHCEIRRINQLLQPWLQNQRAALQNEQQILAAQLKVQAVLGSREYPFCLFEAETLRGQLLDILRATS